MHRDGKKKKHKTRKRETLKNRKLFCNTQLKDLMKQYPNNTLLKECNKFCPRPKKENNTKKENNDKKEGKNKKENNNKRKKL